MRSLRRPGSETGATLASTRCAQSCGVVYARIKVTIDSTVQTGRSMRTPGWAMPSVCAGGGGAKREESREAKGLGTRTCGGAWEVFWAGSPQTRRSPA